MLQRVEDTLIVALIWLKYAKTWLSYEGTSIVHNKNCKMQAHAQVCKENKLEELQIMMSIESILQLKVRV